MGSKGIVKKDENQYLALDGRSREIMEAIRANMGSRRVGIADLEKIKMPSGGATTFEISTLEGPESVKAITGVVLTLQDVRSYWEGKYNGGGTPPDCSSDDLVKGIGNPGGQCNVCPMNLFGSNGYGKACNERRQMLILTADSPLPLFLNVPATSIDNIQNYLLKVATKHGKKFNQFETKFELVKTQSRGGIDYSQITASFVRLLSEEEASGIWEHTKNFSPNIDATEKGGAN